MHASIFFLFAALSQGVFAMECKKGLHYCGSSLLKNSVSFPNPNPVRLQASY